MKKIILIFIILSSNTLIHAQKEITLEDAILGLGKKFAPQRYSLISWTPSSKYYSLVSYDAMDEIRIFDLSNKLLQNIKLSTISSDIKSYNQLSNFKWINDSIFSFNLAHKFYTYNISNADLKNIANLPDDAENVVFTNDYTFFYYTKGNNIYQYSSQSKQEKPITANTDLNIVAGQSVSRNEYGINSGLFVSTLGKKLAYYVKDETEVANYPIIDWQSIPAKNKNIKYPMAGDASEKVSLWIYNTETGKNTKVATRGKEDDYIVQVSWTADDKFLIASDLERTTQKFQMNTYNSLTGEYIKTIYIQKDNKFVEPQKALYSAGNGLYILQSDESGYNHLYVLDIQSGNKKQITKGDWMVNDILGYNASSKEIIYSCTNKSPKDLQIFTSNISSGTLREVTSEPGTHNLVLSPNGKNAIDQYSSDHIANACNSLKIDKKITTQKLFVSSNPLQDYNTADVKNVELKADDGTILYGKIMTPKNMDSQKKYPVIVYLYNGPHVQLIKNKYPASGNLWYDYLCNKGYVVFSMDGRGSSNRGSKFEKAIHGNLGKIELADQLKGVEYLKSLAFVDKDRMGIHGWSFGGFMTTNFMLNQPDVFKVGVAGGPVMDWKMYEIMYTERYMDKPSENPDGYASTNWIKQVDKLKGKFLLIHGTDDPTVVWQHSINFLKECVRQNKQLDYFVYPGHEHNVRGKERVHLMQKVTDYFDLYLKP